MKITIDPHQLRKAKHLLDTSKTEGRVLLLTATPHTEGGTEGSVTAQTYDGIRHTKLTWAANVQEAGSALLPLQGALNLMAKLNEFSKKTDEPARLSRLQGRMAGRIGEVTFNSPIINEEPSLHRFTTQQTLGSITINLDEFKTLLNRVMFACGDDDPETHKFSCVLLKCDSDSIRAIAASMRVAATASIPKGSPFAGKFLLQRDALKTIGKLDGEMITITFHEKGVQFHVSGDITAEIYIPESTGTLPNYEDEFASVGSTTLTGNREDFLHAIMVSKGYTPELTINMTYRGGYVKEPPIFYGRDETGFNGTLPAKNLQWDGNDRKGRVHNETFYQCIEGARGNVKVQFCGAFGVIVITGDGDDYTAVTVPYTPAEKR